MYLLCIKIDVDPIANCYWLFLRQILVGIQAFIEELLNYKTLNEY